MIGAYHHWCWEAIMHNNDPQPGLLVESLGLMPLSVMKGRHHLGRSPCKGGIDRTLACSNAPIRKGKTATAFLPLG